MKVSSKEKAWEEANKIFPYDYVKDEEVLLKRGIRFIPVPQANIRRTGFPIWGIGWK